MRYKVLLRKKSPNLRRQFLSSNILLNPHFIHPTFNSYLGLFLNKDMVVMRNLFNYRSYLFNTPNKDFFKTTNFTSYNNQLSNKPNIFYNFSFKRINVYRNHRYTFRKKRKLRLKSFTNYIVRTLISYAYYNTLKTSLSGSNTLWSQFFLHNKPLLKPNKRHVLRSARITNFTDFSKNKPYLFLNNRLKSRKSRLDSVLDSVLQSKLVPIKFNTRRKLYSRRVGKSVLRNFRKATSNTPYNFYETNTLVFKHDYLVNRGLGHTHTNRTSFTFKAHLLYATRALFKGCKNIYTPVNLPTPTQLSRNLTSLRNSTGDWKKLRLSVHNNLVLTSRVNKPFILLSVGIFIISRFNLSKNNPSLESFRFRFKKKFFSFLAPDQLKKSILLKKKKLIIIRFFRNIKTTINFKLNSMFKLRDVFKNFNKFFYDPLYKNFKNNLTFYQHLEDDIIDPNYLRFTNQNIALKNREVWIRRIRFKPGYQRI